MWGGSYLGRLTPDAAAGYGSGGEDLERRGDEDGDGDEGRRQVFGPHAREGDGPEGRWLHRPTPTLLPASCRADPRKAAIVVCHR